MNQTNTKTDIVIIGAGAAGIGMGILLKKMKLDFVILEKGQVGQSFLQWQENTQFISPSFTGNFFGSPDLNSVCPETSPAFFLQTEHPSGKEYASYLQTLSSYYELPVETNTKVEQIKRVKDMYHIKTDAANIECRFIVWAGGEFQFPKKNVCEGWENGVHNTSIKDFSALKGDTFCVIGGYESGLDTAIALAKEGKKSVLIDSQNHLNESRSDSSFSVSPFTKGRYKEYQSFIQVKPFCRATKIEKTEKGYEIQTDTAETIISHTKPILATGFDPSVSMAKNIFEWQNGTPQITKNDESTMAQNVFLSGPQIQHDGIVFCFIYKFRQRFAIVAETIAHRIGRYDDPVIKQVLTDYQNKNFYLKDLSCCEGECCC